MSLAVHFNHWFIQTITLYITGAVPLVRKKAFTYSNVVRAGAYGVGLIPNSSTWTPVLSACGIQRVGIPGATADVSPDIVVWVVVAEAIRKDVLIGTRVRRTAAVSPNCKAQLSYTIYRPPLGYRSTLTDMVTFHT